MQYLAILAVLLASVRVMGATDWPQWMGPQRDGVWREEGILEKFPEGGPKIRWRVPIGGGYAGPAVANGKVIVTDRVLAAGVENPKNPFERRALAGQERVLCVDETDGRVLWTYAYDCNYDFAYPVGPRTTPIIANGRVYTYGAMGHVCCLELDTGKEVWKRDLKNDIGVESPQWGFAGQPLLEGGLLYVIARGVDTTLVALDVKTGKNVWTALSARDPGYGVPVIYDICGIRTLVVWHPQSINGLDPLSGKVLWSHPREIKAGLTAPMPRYIPQADGSGLLFVTSFYDGSILLKFKPGVAQPEVVYASKAPEGKMLNEKNTDILHSIMPTPLIVDGYVYGVCSYGQFRCIELATGKRVWESSVPTGGPFKNPEGKRWAHTFIVKNGDRVFLPNERGDLLIGKVSPKGFEELSRAHVLDATSTLNNDPLPVLWVHPAFANRTMYWRNDKELVAVSLAKE